MGHELLLIYFSGRRGKMQFLRNIDTGTDVGGTGKVSLHNYTVHLQVSPHIFFRAAFFPAKYDMISWLLK